MAITVVMTGDGSSPIQAGRTIANLKASGILAREFNYQVGGELKDDDYVVQEGDVIVASPKGVEGGK